MIRVANPPRISTSLPEISKSNPGRFYRKYQQKYTFKQHNSEGILLIDCVPRGQTVTGMYYSSLLPKLRRNIKDKRRGMLRAGVILHHDNAAVHTCKLTTAEIRQCGFETLPHPPYSPDLAPSDFHLFPRLKQNLRGEKFDNDEEVIDAVNRFFDTQPKTFFHSG